MKNEITLDLALSTHRVSSMFDLLASTFSDDKATRRAIRTLMTQRQGVEYRPAPGKQLTVAFYFVINSYVHWFTADVQQLDIQSSEVRRHVCDLYLTDLQARGCTQVTRKRQFGRTTIKRPIPESVKGLPEFALNRVDMNVMELVKLKKKLLKRGLDFDRFTVQPETEAAPENTLATRSSLAVDPGLLNVAVAPRQQMHAIDGCICFTHLLRPDGGTAYHDPFEGQAVADLKKPIVVNADELAELLHWANLNSRQVNVFRDSLGWVQALATRDYRAFANMPSRVGPLLDELASSICIGDHTGVAAEKLVMYLVQQTLGDRLALDEFKRYWAEMSSSFSMINDLQESLNART